MLSGAKKLSSGCGIREDPFILVENAMAGEKKKSILSLPLRWIASLVAIDGFVAPRNDDKELPPTPQDGT